MKTYSYNEIVKMYGQKLADDAMSTNAEATNRLMYAAFENPAHIDKFEYASEPVIAENGDSIQAFYYLTEEDIDNMDFFDWKGNAEFQIE